MMSNNSIKYAGIEQNTGAIIFYTATIIACILFILDTSQARL